MEIVTFLSGGCVAGRWLTTPLTAGRSVGRSVGRHGPGLSPTSPAGTAQIRRHRRRRRRPSAIYKHNRTLRQPCPASKDHYRNYLRVPSACSTLTCNNSAPFMIPHRTPAAPRCLQRLVCLHCGQTDPATVQPPAEDHQPTSPVTAETEV